MLFHIALHTGDDNDNSIDRFDIEAESKEKLFDILEAEFLEDFTGNREDVMVDGDGDSLTFLWFESFNEKGDFIGPEECRDDDTSIPYHHDFYIEQE
jgi:hypothetical protein